MMPMSASGSRRCPIRRGIITRALPESVASCCETGSVILTRLRARLPQCEAAACLRRLMNSRKLSRGRDANVRGVR